VRSRDINVSRLHESGKDDIAEAIKQLVKAISESHEMQAKDRAMVLEQLDELSRQAHLRLNNVQRVEF
jgi:delta 1-pyrroline-5-carboxylate dehydrogenase